MLEEVTTFEVTKFFMFRLCCNLLFCCSEDVKLNYQRQLFCQFEAVENNRKCD